MPRIRKTQLAVGFDPDTFRKLSELADQFNTSMNEIVRDCVNNDLPRLVDRYKKRQRRKTNIQ